MARRLTLFACMFAALLIVAPGCDDDGGTGDSSVDGPVADLSVDSDAIQPDIDPDLPPKDCTLRVTKIAGQPVASVTQIDSRLDQDANTAGVQVDVEVEVIGAPDGTEVTLNVTDLATSPTATSANGIASFTGVTITPDTTPVATITAAATNCTGFELKRNTQPDPSCTFDRPMDGATLTKANDKIGTTTAFEYDVRVQTANAAGGSVTLQVGTPPSTTPNSPATPNAATGIATFFSTTLPPTASQKVKLKATVTRGPLTAMCEIEITLNITDTPCNLTGPSPAPVNGGLGPNQDKDAGTAGLQTTISVSSPGDEVELFIGGQSQGTKPTSNGTASWDVTLPNGQANVQATCRETASGNSGQSAVGSYTVDLNPPAAVSDLACAITNHRAGTIRCTYTTPSDGTDGSGVKECKLHYRTNDDIDASNFDATNTIKRIIPAANPGTLQTATTTGLTMPNEYDFAVTCVDELGNESSINTPALARLKVFFKQQDISGPAPGSRFGLPIVTGDFNCDGLTDMAVGLFDARSGQGDVEIYFSSGAGFPTSFSTKLSGTQAGARFGNALVALNFDNDTDGCADIAVWAPGSGNGPRGKVYLYLGAKNFTQRTDVGGPSPGADIVYQLPAAAVAGDRIVGALAALDFNGDGFGDLAMIYNAANGSSSVVIDYGESGVTSIIGGGSSLQREMPTNADLKVVGGASANLFGVDMGNGGNLDTTSTSADPYNDLLIGAPLFQNGGTRVGAAYVVRGAQSGATLPDADIDIGTSARVVRIEGDSNSGLFGVPIVGVGDLNGDGVPEFAVGDALFGGNRQGQVYIFNLATTPSTIADAAGVVANDLTSPDDDRLGRRIANGARIDPVKGLDINNDGRADLVIGTSGLGPSATGNVLVFYGRSGALSNLTASGRDLLLKPPANGSSGFSREIQPLGDINGDGFPDIAVGDPDFSGQTGRVTIFF